MTTRENVAALYIATFNRAADADGVAYWVDAIENKGLTIQNVAQSFFDSAEAKALYPDSVTTDQFVKTVYSNILDREVDSDGLNYWTSQLDNGLVTKGNFILAIDNAVAEQTSSDDALLRENKIKASEYYVDQGLSDASKAEEVLSGVTKDVETVYFSNQLVDVYARAESSGSDASVNNVDYRRLTSVQNLSDEDIVDAIPIVLDEATEYDHVVAFKNTIEEGDYHNSQQTYIFYAEKDHIIDFTSLSYWDPSDLTIFDKYGYPIERNDEIQEIIDLPYLIEYNGVVYDTDIIADWKAPYTGVFYLSSDYSPVPSDTTHAVIIVDYGII